MNGEIDVRHILPAIRVPTLVLHRTGDPRVSVEAGRHLGKHISGASYVELPGEDHGIFDVEFADRLADEIEEFLTGSHTESEPDRVLATYFSPTSSARRSAQPNSATTDGAYCAIARRRCAAGTRPLSRP